MNEKTFYLIKKLLHKKNTHTMYNTYLIALKEMQENIASVK